MIYNLEFLNKNSLVNYPLREDVSRTSVNGDFVIPNSLILDFIMVVPENMAGHRFYIKRLTLLSTLLTFEIYDETDAPVFVLAVNLTTHVAFTGYDVNGVSTYASARGRVVLGDTADTLLLPSGQFTFDISATEFELTCVRPDIRGINGLILNTAGTLSTPIYGDIQLVAGSNFHLSEISPGVIQLSAISGADLDAVDPCTTALQLPPPIRSINGFLPDGNGNFVISGSSCMDLATSAGSLQFTDKCSSSCCGCNELEWLTDRLEILVRQSQDITDFSAALASQFEDFKNNIMATTS